MSGLDIQPWHVLVSGQCTIFAQQTTRVRPPLTGTGARMSAGTFVREEASYGLAKPGPTPATESNGASMTTCARPPGRAGSRPAKALITMQLRRSLVSATVAVAIAFSLSSCGVVDRIRGFDYATDRDYTPAAGTNDRSGNVKILSAVVVSAIEGQGTLVTSLANSDMEDPSTLTGVAGTYSTPEGVVSEVKAEAFDPVEIPAKGLINLADLLDESPIILTGEFEAGNMLVLTFTFEDGQTTTFDVPAVSNFSPSVWAGLDRAPGAEDATAPATPEAPAGHGSGH